MSEQTLKTKMSEVEKFKTAIVKIRDILRSSSITGMDSMRHICLYMLGPYLTLQNVKELGIPEKFAWENRYNILKEDPDHQIQDFGNELIDNFDRLFGTQKFSFDLKSGTKHKEIMEMLSSVNMKDVDLHMDVLGYIYEQHLKTGASAARDLGQFFTDRFICEYMVKLCSPKLKNGDIPESVCDPTMGTGGFLTAYLKYFKDVDWKIHQSQVHGVDHDAKVAGVARLNMFMESKGQLFKHLHTADSLHGGLDPTTYDIILANMPFGLKGLKYKDVHSSIKPLGLDGTKSEPLFLQLMMVSLNKGGRCAVVVPDGMLVNDSKCHNGTRKYLLENFELKRIIKMKGKFFMNTAIQPSIILFENSGNKTKQIEFWDVERDDKGNFNEKKILSVNSDKIDDTWSLDFKIYQENEKINYGPNFELFKLGDVASIEIGGTPKRSCSEYYKNGEHLWVSVSELNNNVIMDTNEKINDLGVKNSNVKLVKQGSILMSFKLSIGKCAIAGKDLYTNEAIASINSLDETKLSNKYLYHYLNSTDLTNKGKGSLGNGSMNKKSLHQLEIPIPSLKTQLEIVNYLNNIDTSIINILKVNNQIKDKVITKINQFKFDTEKLKKYKNDINKLEKLSNEMIELLN